MKSSTSNFQIFDKIVRINATFQRVNLYAIMRHFLMKKCQIDLIAGTLLVLSAVSAHPNILSTAEGRQ